VLWPTPPNRQTANQAGDVLISDDRPSEDESLWALEVVNTWRSSHGLPLQCIKMTLKKRARRIDPHALVAQRIKRIPAIKFKLLAHADMRLSQMQDVGGCRAVMNTVKQVEELAKVYDQAAARNPTRGTLLAKKYDYIAHPKPSGYRGIHLVYKYMSDRPRFAPYNNLKIEIQLRSRLQHAWATAVETVDAYTGQALKSNVGEKDWKRFFAVMATIIALDEGRPPIPDTPTSAPELRAELTHFKAHVTLIGSLALATIVSDRDALKKAPSKLRNADLYILELNVQNRSVRVHGFMKTELPAAQQAYLDLEKQNTPAQILTVMVAADSVNALKKAYPNYFLDIRTFVGFLTNFLKSP
jgi:ppGpp synthetase/RelA/SpoT-type nucleotidyltranferase